jgi:hypothetical protein
MVSFGYSIVCPSSNYRSDYPFGNILKTIYLIVYYSEYGDVIKIWIQTARSSVWRKVWRYQSGNQNGKLKMDRLDYISLYNNVVCEGWLSAIYVFDFGTIPTVQYYIVSLLDFGLSE